MLIYLDVKYTADALKDKIKLYKNTKILTSKQCTGYDTHKILKILLFYQLFLILSA